MLVHHYGYLHYDFTVFGGLHVKELSVSGRTLHPAKKIDHGFGAIIATWNAKRAPNYQKIVSKQDQMHMM